MENISENSSVGEEEYDFSENTQTSSSHSRCQNRSYPEMLTTAAILSVSLTDNRSTSEVEILINFLHLLEQNIQYILTQRLIDEKNRTSTDTTVSL